MHPHVRRSPEGSLIGITGGYGSGKSTVAAMVAERFPVLYSDAIAKDIVAKDRLVQAELRKSFGAEIFPLRGPVNRAALASIVFNNPVRLKRLNAIVHPVTIERIAEEASALFISGTSLVFVESALIFEAGIEDLFSFVIAVVSKQSAVLSRMKEAGFERETVRLRLRSQLDPNEKAQRADFLVRNDGTREELRSNVLFLLSLIEILCAKK